MKLATMGFVSLLASWPYSLAMAQTPAPAPPALGSAPSTIDEARRHFLRGVDLFRDASLDAAFAEFERANEIAPNYRILYNLAQVAVERHDYASALGLFRSYLDRGGSDIAPARRAEVESALQELGLRVSQVSIDSNAKGAEILIDDVPVGTVPLMTPVPVNAGVRLVLLRRPGYASTTRSFTFVGGEQSHLDLQLSPAASGSREPDAIASDEGPPAKTVSRTGMWIGLTATAVLGAASATCAVLTKRADDDLNASLNQYRVDRHRVDSERSREKTFSGLADGFAVGAVLSFGFSVYAALTAGKAQAREKPSPRPEADVRVVPTGLGLDVLGHF